MNRLPGVLDTLKPPRPRSSAERTSPAASCALLIPGLPMPSYGRSEPQPNLHGYTTISSAQQAYAGSNGI